MRIATFDIHSEEIPMPQSLAKVYVHFVFSTKNREPILDAAWRDELFRVIGGAANNLGCQSLIVGGVADHVHVLFQLGRTISIADAVGKIKSTSSSWIGQTKNLDFHWQAGYAAFSVSQSNLEAVRIYSESRTASRANLVSGRTTGMVAAI